MVPPSTASSGSNMHNLDYYLLVRLLSLGFDKIINYLCTSQLLWKLCVNVVVASSEIRAC